MSHEFQRLLYQESDGVALITLNRPEKRNALDDPTIEELKAALRLGLESHTARVIGLQGAGRDFCSGLDLSALRKIAHGDVKEHLDDAHSMLELFLQMRALPKPIVGMVRGRALAGGCGLASACDLVLASDTAEFGYVEIRIAFVAAIVMAMLRRSVGEKKACELLLTGGVIGAVEAERIGLINHVFPDGEFEQRCQAWLHQLTEKAALALRMTKELLYRIDGMPLEQAMRCGADINALARMTEECRQGVARFLEKKS
ncbi:MAG: enoyl-CoA hydratase/isomerase family protein [Acidobacteria bacterium]|nr:enoyl-CoA hydratase/isomerase family protein [Acidobacteriota bacterium]